VLEDQISIGSRLNVSLASLSIRNPNSLIRHRRVLPVLIILLGMLLSTSAYAVDVTLAWDPNTEPDLDGYTVYYSVDSAGPPYDYVGDLPLDQLPDPDNPQVTLTELDKFVNYHFAVTAYDTEGNESNFSSSLCIYIDDVVQECEPADGLDAMATGGGGGGSSNGGACFIGSAGEGVRSPFGPFVLAIDRPAIWTFALILFLMVTIYRKNIQRHSNRIYHQSPFMGGWS
jgi:hypothetical protein